MLCTRDQHCTVCCVPGTSIIPCVVYQGPFCTMCYVLGISVVPGISISILPCVVYQGPVLYCVLCTRDQYYTVCCVPGTILYYVLCTRDQCCTRDIDQYLPCVVYQGPVLYCVLCTRDQYCTMCCVLGTRHVQCCRRSTFQRCKRIMTNMQCKDVQSIGPGGSLCQKYPWN